MKTLRLLFGLAASIGVVAIAGLWPAPSAARAETTAAPKRLYTCSMHPQILLDHPGNCPVCGMKLVPVRVNAALPAAKVETDPPAAATGEHKIKFYKSTMIPGEISTQPGKDSMGMEMVPVYSDEGGGNAEAITIDPVTIQKMNLKTGLVREGPVRREIRAVGTVEFDQEGLHDITTRYEGWIEKLLVDATWSQVRAGQPLFEIYSPDLYNAELNYLIAFHSEGAAGGPLTHAAHERLRLFDVPDTFLAELARTGEAPQTFVFRAPADGVVMEKDVVQGMMIKPGQRIYRLADLSTVWVNAQIYENDLAFVHTGQEARVRSTYGGDSDFTGKVDLLLPEVENATRTAQARIVLSNPALELKPGMFVEVRLEAELSPSAVLVPDMAVLRSGERDTVFVALPDGSFLPREVKLGARTQDNDYQVLSGLNAGERVVTSGQFMLDSESQLREAIQKMLHGSGSSNADTATPHASASPLAGHRVKYYKSTMNPGEISEHPGKDSMGMDMVPVYDESGAAVDQR
jgi:multidrug efflux pump subunit AcrA (membrane-fusion protein)